MLHRSAIFGEGVRAILFHHFFFEDEPADRARERLKRQCDWLCRNFSLVTPKDLQRGLAANLLSPKSLLVTIDDAKLEILRVLDIFQSFDIPICIFACAGWSARETTRLASPDIALATVVANIEWYRGSPLGLNVEGQAFRIGASDDQKARAIDAILSCPGPSALDLPPELRRPRQGQDRVCCSLDELAGIASDRIAIGGHSVSHIRLATATLPRLRYEIGATRKILAGAIGHCETFAYPYGMLGTYNEVTDRVIKEAGFDLAFLTHSDLISAETDRYKLPRISMPDRALPYAEFRLRAAGAGIIYRKLKGLLHKG